MIGVEKGGAVNEIKPTANEYAEERFEATTLQRAVTALHTDGFAGD